MVSMMKSNAVRIGVLFAIGLTLEGCPPRQSPATITVTGLDQMFLGIPVVFAADSTRANDTSFTWSSSDPSVLMIDPDTGQATGLTVGTADVRAQGGASGNSGSFTVQVSDLGDGVLALGRAHTPMGTATLQESDGTLTVSNIGLSGDDGVAIEVGSAEAVLLDLENLTLTSGTDALSVRATIGDPMIPKQSSAEVFLDVISDGSFVRVNPDFTQLSSGFSSLVMMGGEVQIVQPNCFVDHVDTAPISGVTSGFDSSGPNNDGSGPPQAYIGIQYGKLIEFSIAGNMIMGDELRFVATDTPSSLMQPLTEVSLALTNVPEITIIRERTSLVLGMGLELTPGPFVEAVGNTALDAVNEELVVANISGIVGPAMIFGILLSPQQIVTPCDIVAVEFGAVPTLNEAGQSFALTLRGVLIDPPLPKFTLVLEEWSAAMFTRTDQGTELSTDWSPVLGSTVLVEVHNNGQPVGTVTLPSPGVLGMFPAQNGIDIVETRTMGSFTESPIQVIVLKQARLFMAANGTEMTGDELHISSPDSNPVAIFEAGFIGEAAASFSILEASFIVGLIGPMV